ncbi:hypothetical protein [Caballeronia concitans]|nr:hypothetical protein [Caballeronia concitans]KIG03702.1 hypothetical protein BurMR1_4664 [Burkholderia sp. MR1]
MMHIDENAALPTRLIENEDARIATPVRKRNFGDVRADANRLRRALAASTCMMVAWSLFEVPWEVDTDSSLEQWAAVITAKALLMAVAWLSLQGRRIARYVLLFVCLTSVLAIAPELPGEFVNAPWLAVLSSVECLAKFATLALIALHMKPRMR